MLNYCFLFLYFKRSVKWEVNDFIALTNLAPSRRNLISLTHKALDYEAP